MEPIHGGASRTPESNQSIPLGEAITTYHLEKQSESMVLFPVTNVSISPYSSSVSDLG